MAELRDRSARTPAARPVARHGRQPRSTAWKGFLGLIGIVVAVAMVATTSVAGAYVLQLRQSFADNSVVINSEDAKVPTIGAYEGGFNMLIVGSDADSDRDGARNDVNILLHVSADQTNAIAVSIPRDLVIPIPSCTDPDTGRTSAAMTAQPINVALSYGGMPCAVATVEKLTGLDIQFAGEISFSGVAAMATAVGGVDVCLATDFHDPFTNLRYTAGTHHMEGSEAMLFLRSRHGVGDGSDLTRISSQQVFLSSLLRKVKSQGTLTDVTKLFALATAARDNMTLSKELASLDTMVAMAKALSTVSLTNMVFVQYPATTGGTGVYSGKAAPVTSKAKELFDAVKADKGIALTEVGDGTGSRPDPNATPTPTDPSATATPTPGATDAPATTPPAETVTIDGVRGQTAADQTCTVGYLK